MAEMNRRDFIVTGALTLGACAGCQSTATTRTETANAMARTEAAKGPVEVGPISGFSNEGIYDRWADAHTFFLIRESGRLYAVSAMCTHKRFELVSTEGALKCPKHGSIFNTSGKPTKAPARQPLPRFAIRLDAQSHVIVDPSREFSEKQWNDPASYIAV